MMAGYPSVIWLGLAFNRHANRHYKVKTMLPVGDESSAAVRICKAIWGLDSVLCLINLVPTPAGNPADDMLAKIGTGAPFAMPLSSCGSINSQDPFLRNELHLMMEIFAVNIKLQTAAPVFSNLLWRCSLKRSTFFYQHKSSNHLKISLRGTKKVCLSTSCWELTRNTTQKQSVKAPFFHTIMCSLNGPEVGCQTKVLLCVCLGSSRPSSRHYVWIQYWLLCLNKKRGSENDS